MKLILEANIETAKYWLKQEISDEERKMWKQLIKDCEKLLEEEG